jgi:hypothetical protein
VIQRIKRKRLLASAKTLQKQIPELIFFTFDSKLKVAAKGEKFTLF